MSRCSKFVACLFAVGWLALLAGPAAADVVVPWSGERSGGQGVDALPYNAFNGQPKLTWDITYDSTTQLFTYTYAFYDHGSPFAPQHFIFEVADDFQSSGGQLSLLGHGSGAWNIGTWVNDVNNPTLPGDLHGVKIDVEAATHTLITDRAPTWGDFYWKKGSPRDRQGPADAWNAGFGDEPGQTQSYESWMAVPGTETAVIAVPTPTAGAMSLVLLAGLMARRGRCRRRI